MFLIKVNKRRAERCQHGTGWAWKEIKHLDLRLIMLKNPLRTRMHAAADLESIHSLQVSSQGMQLGRSFDR